MTTMMLPLNVLATFSSYCIFALTIVWVELISASTIATVTEGIPVGLKLAKPTTATTTTTTREDNALSAEYDGQRSLLSNELTSSEYDDDFELSEDELDDFQRDLDWDVLIFTQSWPVTTCFQWREEDRTHPCLLPSKKEFWIIHGIWPTKLGRIGPNFCNKSAEFRIDQIVQIVDRLKLYWPEIDGKASYDWLWRHEWLKHGTCASQLEAINNELKYFEQGLDWRDRYLISNILGAAGIHPDSNNTVISLHTALINQLRKNPSIHCLYDNKNDVSYLSEIRICFNKTLQLTDCDGVKRGDAVSIDYPGGTVHTNCHISKPVHYPNLVPPTLRKQREREWKFPVVNLYKLVQFIMWFTL